jgi:hypothetical protein
MPTPRLSTYDAAIDALAEATLDVALDAGEDAAFEAHHDLVRCVAARCTPAVAAELILREGVQREDSTRAS